MGGPETNGVAGGAAIESTPITEQPQEHLQQEADDLPQHGERDETPNTPSQMPEHVILAAGITVDVRSPPDAAASPHLSREHPNPVEEQLQSKGQQSQSVIRRGNGSAQMATALTSTAPTVPNPAEREATSPYRAVYPLKDILTDGGSGERATSGESPEQQHDAFQETLNSLRGIASRARESFSRVAQGGIADFRRARESIHRVGTGDFSDLAAVERYLGGVLDDCAAFSEKICPCGSPEIHQDTVERASGPSPITMLVDTPGGPYVRMIPESLVEESIQQGLLSATDVERQRRDAVYGAAPPLM